jgi:CTP:molybdopterin cytidylyltransferase MocA
VLLGDQPNVDANMLRRLLDLHEQSGRPAAAVSSDGVVMPPVVLSGDFLQIALHAVGDTGVRGALRAHPELVTVLLVEPNAVQDVDTTKDLDRVVGSRE